LVSTSFLLFHPFPFSFHVLCLCHHQRLFQILFLLFVFLFFVLFFLDDVTEDDGMERGERTRRRRRRRRRRERGEKETGKERVEGGEKGVFGDDTSVDRDDNRKGGSGNSCGTCFID